ncbi:MAG: hypothetical protein IPL16_12220 [Ignavibacteria bacterium]|nr:hypothetical protein [Ignavibacteria bacterium]
MSGCNFNNYGQPLEKWIRIILLIIILHLTGGGFGSTDNGASFTGTNQRKFSIQKSV